MAHYWRWIMDPVIDLLRGTPGASSYIMAESFQQHRFLLPKHSISTFQQEYVYSKPRSPMTCALICNDLTELGLSDPLPPNPPPAKSVVLPPIPLATK